MVFDMTTAYIGLINAVVTTGAKLNASMYLASQPSNPRLGSLYNLPPLARGTAGRKVGERHRRR